VLSWEYDAPDGARPLGARDETQGLSMSGLVSFAAPRDLTERSRFGRSRYWLRARWQRGTFPLPPRLRRVSLNTMWATQAVTVHDVILGSSNGNPGQVFTTAQPPVRPASSSSTGKVSQTRPAFWMPGRTCTTRPQDRHYTLDPLTGEIRFGDGSSGCIPAPGQNNVHHLPDRRGEQGNRGADTIIEEVGVPYIDGVTNHECGYGRRATNPSTGRLLRHSGARKDRAVTAADRRPGIAAHPQRRAFAVVPASTPSASGRPAGRATADHPPWTLTGRAWSSPGDADTDRPTPSLGPGARYRTTCKRFRRRYCGSPTGGSGARRDDGIPASFAEAD
jgi:hypothetical protein